MEIICVSPTRDSAILSALLPLAKTQPKFTEISLEQRQSYSKNLNFTIWPVLLDEHQHPYHGLHSVIKYLFSNTPLLTPQNSSLTESAFSLADALFATAVPLICRAQSIVIPDSLFESSQKTLKALLPKLTKFISDKPTLASVYVQTVVNILAALEIDVSPAKAQPIPSEGLLDDALNYAFDTLAIPERYAMSPRPEKKMYFSTPIYYVNGRPHIGHVFTTTLVESLSNWYKLRDIPIIYSTGTDEHGIKVQSTAQENGSTPQAWCDKTSTVFREAFKEFDLQPDVFIRTTEPRHIQVATTFWKILADKGYIYKGKYEGWYSKREESFIPDNQIEDKVVDGKTIKINKEDGAELVWSSEDNYMFKLSAMRDQLLNWLDSNPNVITPKPYWNQIRSLVLGELRDISVSRLKSTVSWGVPVPGDEQHTMYVWIEALVNYLTVAGWSGLGPDQQGIWPCDVHTVGKDIVKFHGLFWPAFLMAAGVPVYKRLLVHGWWTKDNTKMSKSLGNTLDPIVLRDFWGLEPVKYFLLHECTLVSDSDYSLLACFNLCNNDLCDVLGNLVLRIISPKLNSEMVVPQPGEYTELDKALIHDAELISGTVDHHVAFGRTRKALIAIWEFLRGINKFLTDVKPWTIKDQARLNTVNYVLCESIRIAALCIYSFLPQTAKKILQALGTDAHEIPGDDKFKFGQLKPGTKITQIPPLFTKKDKKEIE